MRFVSAGLLCVDKRFILVRLRNSLYHEEAIMAVTVSLSDAKNKISQLLDRVIVGHEEVIIAEDGKPLARLVAIESVHGPDMPGRRVPGSAMGQIVLSPDFDAPLPDDVLELFES